MTLAWLTEAFARTKTLPKLDKLLHQQQPQGKPVTEEDVKDTYKYSNVGKLIAEKLKAKKAEQEVKKPT